MAIFVKDGKRTEPYKTFRFHVKWAPEAGGKMVIVAGIQKVGAMKRTTEVIDFRNGGDPTTTNHSPGLTSFEPISLERGLTHDEEFHTWANSVGNPVTPLPIQDTFLKDIEIELLDEAGVPVVRYKVKDCWVSEYQSLPDLDASANEIAIETMTLQHAGWAKELIS